MPRRFPLPEQAAEAQAKRRIGLGRHRAGRCAADGRACAMGRDEAAAVTEAWMHAIARAAYLASVDLAKEKGAVPAVRRREVSWPPATMPADGRGCARGDRASTASATRC